MKIDKVTCWVLRVPLNYPLLKETFYPQVSFVEIETDDGLKGNAMAEYPLAFSIREFVNREVAPTIRGMDPMRTEEARTAILHHFGKKHFSGVFGCSISLIDIALWDIKGKATQQPIWKLLGGARNRVPVYITFGLERYTKEELVEAAKMLVASGQDKLKMVVAAGVNPATPPLDSDILRDVERVRAVREAVGDKVKLMADANNCASYNQAVCLARSVEPYDLTWLEDPIAQADPRLIARLRKEVPVPIAAGSSSTSDLVQFREYLLNESVDFIQPNVREIGGYTGGLRAAALAQAFNIPMQMGGNWPHMNMHLHAGVPNGGMVEFHLRGWRVVETCSDGTVSPVNGWVTLPETPGLGYTPKEGIVREYAVE